MDKIRKIMTPFLFFNFTLIGCILNNIGQSKGALLSTNMVSLDGKLSPKSDRTAISTNKEIEDTIREINHYSLSDSLWKMWRAI